MQEGAPGGQGQGARPGGGAPAAGATGAASASNRGLSATLAKSGPAVPPPQPGGPLPGQSGGHSIGVAWLLGDMVLVTFITVLVKAGGASYPAAQMVLIRSLVGLVTVLPLAWRHRSAILGTRRRGAHVVRVLFNTLALNANFVALTLLPLALANAIGFLRPLVVMALASWLLAERSGRWRWIGALIGLVGVLVMLAPALGGLIGGGPLTGGAAVPGGRPGDGATTALQAAAAIPLLGILAALGSVLFGSLTTVQTRALAGENTTVLMVFYTVGLSVFTAGPAMLVWRPVAAADWPILLGIGVLAQVAQYCFLRAYQSAPANVLAPFSYLSIGTASLAGWLAFGEIPAPTTLAGAAIIIGALLVSTRMDRR